VTDVAANLHISVTSSSSTAPPLRERVEQKFFVRPERMALALALLSRACRRDPLHPADQVNSLYFDTFDLEEHSKSDSGDSAKDKIRIRWYGREFDPHVRTDPYLATPDDLPSGGNCTRTLEVWLERKTRRGFASTKQRLSMEVPTPSLSPARLGEGIVPPAVLASTMAGFGLFPRGRLCPVIAISYWRYRFVEPCTGFRVSMDSRIRSSIVLRRIGRGERGLELPGAVVEVKGDVFALPTALRPLADIGSSWTRYSKYSSSLDAHAAGLGSVSRAWPSGVLAKDSGLRARVARSTLAGFELETEQPPLTE
jgi:hypothetical protein